MSDRRHIEPVEDYTKPFLVCLGVLIFSVLFVIAVIWGFLASLFSGWVMDRSIVVAGGAIEKRRIERGPKRW